MAGTVTAICRCRNWVLNRLNNNSPLLLYGIMQWVLYLGIRMAILLLNSRLIYYCLSSPILFLKKEKGADALYKFCGYNLYMALCFALWFLSCLNQESTMFSMEVQPAWILWVEQDSLLAGTVLSLAPLLFTGYQRRLVEGLVFAGSEQWRTIAFIDWACCSSKGWAREPRKILLFLLSTIGLTDLLGVLSP